MNQYILLLLFISHSYNTHISKRYVTYINILYIHTYLVYVVSCALMHRYFWDVKPQDYISRLRGFRLNISLRLQPPVLYDFCVFNPSKNTFVRIQHFSKKTTYFQNTHVSKKAIVGKKTRTSSTRIISPQ